MIRRRGNQVKSLNRPATVSPNARFDKTIATASKNVGRRFKTGTSQETCQGVEWFKVFEEQGI